MPRPKRIPGEPPPMYAVTWQWLSDAGLGNLADVTLFSRSGLEAILRLNPVCNADRVMHRTLEAIEAELARHELTFATDNAAVPLKLVLTAYPLSYRTNRSVRELVRNHVPDLTLSQAVAFGWPKIAAKLRIYFDTNTPDIMHDLTVLLRRFGQQFSPEKLRPGRIPLLRHPRS